MKSIVVLGSLNMDLVVRTPRLPQPGETLIGGPFQTFPGGKGANQAVAIARLGVPVVMIGRVGKDAFGTTLLAAARQDGVDSRGISQDENAATGVALITVENGGQNTIIVAPGANHRLTPEIVEQHKSIIQDASLLVMQLEVPLETVCVAARIARAAGVRVLLNPSPFQMPPPGLLRDVSVLILNETELGLLARGLELSQASQRLVEQGAEAVVVTLGAQGAYLQTGESESTLPAFPVEAVDAVAAGDAFIGAFAVALAEGKSMFDAACWGNAAGALAVTRQGAQPSLPRRAELLGMLAIRGVG